MTVSGYNVQQDGFLKRVWQRIREPLARSEMLKTVLVNLISGYLRLVYATNKRLPGFDETIASQKQHTPYIVTFWHGQHLMGTFVREKSVPVVAMFSRSADAELNARVAEKLGLQTVRGSGGRADSNNSGKGGARALITLKRALDQGISTGMIADVAHSPVREAGQGIILLAKLSGRPILPVAYAFSRCIVLQRSWDKTSIPLPFGRSAAVTTEPVWVPVDADENLLEEKRLELTRKLDAATDAAYKQLGLQTPPAR
ncbi:lysophospholipid acyltransferase family protein [Pseudochrobactrum asaccharolyticum]|uniref:lysophospholipid acyltransferase family protein n=1 Tax=Pseudochrobactrum asaccharolyticum TaxID=354351 RepID=UPI0035BBA8C8